MGLKPKEWIGDIEVKSLEQDVSNMAEERKMAVGIAEGENKRWAS